MISGLLLGVLCFVSSAFSSGLESVQSVQRLGPDKYAVICLDQSSAVVNTFDLRQENICGGKALMSEVFILNSVAGWKGFGKCSKHPDKELHRQARRKCLLENWQNLEIVDSECKLEHRTESFYTYCREVCSFWGRCRL